MNAKFLEEIREEGVVRKYDDGSIRVFLGDMPLGRKLQTPGPRCKRHTRWVKDVYDGLRGEYEDKVCLDCGRRIMVR